MGFRVRVAFFKLNRRRVNIIHFKSMFKNFQVKHLEQLLKLRHPNSIPALALLSDVCNIHDQHTKSDTQSTEILKERIRELEAQLSVVRESDIQSLHLLQKDYEKLKVL